MRQSRSFATNIRGISGYAWPPDLWAEVHKRAVDKKKLVAIGGSRSICVFGAWLGLLCLLITYHHLIYPIL